jgi:hypothetical protein
MNTSSLTDRAREEERVEQIRRDNAVSRWRAPMQEKADRAAEKKEDLPAVASGGSYL